MANQEQELIQIFQVLTVVHEQMNEKALLKQEAVKKGNIPELEQVMKEEAALIQKLRKLENTRLHAVGLWMKEKGFVEETATMETLLKYFPERLRPELEEWSQRLVAEITKLKHQNELNQQLIEESLRFVNMSLDSMNPQQEFGNYKRPQDKGDNDFESTGRSLFDSKA
ncbi:flagellar biosynthesis/type III secretory pathway chaperone [Evansella vedderi]|uniref:Flagellar biosynthesis/type III secretory pathway chaperone n=1 Tax=Evansella vedderi TaxID=38282 RepID=A0ABT9ZTG4_9BACI|nr:flagellar protein FlgN [Evansella vedderi]MDQ0254527.1 flagellar biosynthesis/type III secretory pathway chaperone [Evansella vedderi]